jgi:Predicted membrane protein (DUF2232)
MGRLARAGVAVACGGVGGGLYLAVLSGSSGSVVLVYMAQLPLFIAGLWLGVPAAVLAGLSASLLLLSASDFLAAGLFAGVNAAPVIVLVRQALLARAGGDGRLEWYPPGLLTAWLTGLALAGLVVALLLLGGPGGVEAELRTALAPPLDRLIGESAPERAGTLHFLAMIVPGVVAASWMTVAAINASLAQGLLARFKANWRPSPDFSELALPAWMPILLALAALATMIDGGARFLGANVMILLAVPFCLAGLAVLHAFARRFTYPALFLLGVYALIGALGWPLLLVAALGLLDSSIGLKRRLARRQPSRGKFDG